MFNGRLINDEVEMLAREVELAKQRLRDAIHRAAPQPVQDWILHNPDGSPVKLTELFGGRQDLILWHNMGRSCVYCTLWADGLRGYAEHIQDRAAFALCSADEPAVLKEFAASRGWQFRCVSSTTAPGGFLRAMNMADEKGGPWPGVSAFRRRADGSIVRTGYAYFGPGDDFCAVWPMFDLLQSGAGDWSPKYSYRPDVASIGLPPRA